MHWNKTLWGKVIPHMSQNRCMCGHVAPRDARTASCGLVCLRTSELTKLESMTPDILRARQDHTTLTQHSLSSSCLSKLFCWAAPCPKVWCWGPWGCVLSAGLSRAHCCWVQSGYQLQAGWCFQGKLRQRLNILGTSRWDVKPTLLDRVSVVEITYLCKQSHSLWSMVLMSQIPSSSASGLTTFCSTTHMRLAYSISH